MRGASPARVLLGYATNLFLRLSDQRLDLVPLVSSPSWQFDQDNLWRLPGAHGEEVVRSIYLDERVCLAIPYHITMILGLILCAFVGSVRLHLR